MAFNKFMHPRNPYKDSPPNFEKLAEKYEQFRRHCYGHTASSVLVANGQQNSCAVSGKLNVDFKNPDAVRWLAWALLKDDFCLDVELPVSCLVPRIPSRLNYILWLEDLLQCSRQTTTTSTSDGDAVVWGVDIGTGASCVYPLLGAKQCGWRFVATESDPASADCARRNVGRNSLDDSIKVVSVDEDTALVGVINQLSPEIAQFQFCMCNPPFFDSSNERRKFPSTGSDDSFTTTIEEDQDGNPTCSQRQRSDPHSATVAKETEMFTEGGEVAFIGRIIRDSVQLGRRIRIYTSMVGKKSSVAQVKRLLQTASALDVIDTAFCQGKTQRWAVAWTFDPDVKFSKECKNRGKAPKVPTSTFEFPRHIAEQYTVEWTTDWMLDTFKELRISYERCAAVGETEEGVCYRCVAERNTWSNQRQKRRSTHASRHCSPVNKRQRVEAEHRPPKWCCVDASTEVHLGLGDGTDSLSVNGAAEAILVAADTADGRSGRRHVAIQAALTDSEYRLQLQKTAANDSRGRGQTSAPVVVFSAAVSANRSGGQHSKETPAVLVATLKWMDGGTNRDALNQIAQFCRNRLALFNSARCAANAKGKR